MCNLPSFLWITSCSFFISSEVLDSPWDWTDSWFSTVKSEVSEDIPVRAKVHSYISAHAVFDTILLPNSLKAHHNFKTKIPASDCFWIRMQSAQNPNCAQFGFSFSDNPNQLPGICAWNMHAKQVKTPTLSQSVYINRQTDTDRRTRFTHHFPWPNLYLANTIALRAKTSGSYQS